MLKILIAAGFLTALTACDQAILYKDTAIKYKEEYSNQEADVVKRAPCLMTVGAYNRILTEKEKQGVSLLCGGNYQPTTEELITKKFLQDNQITAPE